MSSSPDHSSSNIKINQSEQRLDQQLNNIQPVLGNVINSLFNSFKNTKSSQNLSNPPEDQQQNLEQFDKLIETPLVQQFLTSINAEPNQIKDVVHMHHDTLNQKMTAFQPILTAIRTRSNHIIDEILSHPNRIISILFENSPDLIKNFLAEKGFGQVQLENFLEQIPQQSSITKNDLIEKLQNNEVTTKIKDELKKSSLENFTLNNCLEQLTSTPNLQAFSNIINLLGQTIINQTNTSHD